MGTLKTAPPAEGMFWNGSLRQEAENLKMVVGLKMCVQAPVTDCV